MADHISGYVAIMNADETKKILDGNGNLSSIEILAQGEGKIDQDPVSFGAEVVYDNMDQQFFDGTINLLIEGGDIITAQFKSASISEELDAQGFFAITPSPLQGVVIGGEGAYKGATGTIDLFGRIMPGGQGTWMRLYNEWHCCIIVAHSHSVLSNYCC